MKQLGLFISHRNDLCSVYLVWKIEKFGMHVQMYNLLRNPKWQYEAAKSISIEFTCEPVMS